MIRRDLAPQDEGRLVAAVRDPRPELGVDAPFDTRRDLLEAPGGRPFLVRSEMGGTTWVGRRQSVWLSGKRVSFGELLPLAGPVEGSAPAEPGDEEAVLWSLTTSARWEQLELELGFELVRTPLKLVAALDEVRAAATPGIEVERATGFPGEVQGLGERLAAECGALGQRDQAFLTWRFGDPSRGYRIALARRGSELVGCTVLRRGTLDGRPDQGLVVEWLVPREEAGAGRALRGALVAMARAEGARELVAIVPEWTEEWTRFQADGFHAEPTRYVLCARHRQRRHDAFWLFKNWYYTLADGALA